MRSTARLKPLFVALFLCASLASCDKNEDKTFVQKIAESDAPEQHQTFTNNLNGVDVKITYYYKGDVILRQTAENTLPYDVLAAKNKEHARMIIEQIAGAYRETEGVSDVIEYFDDRASEHMTIDFSKAKISELCKLPGINITDCSGKYLSMARSERLILKDGFKALE
ncbi:TPA: YehR family lipoprotein [Klebsiella oxytoca]